MTDEHTVEHKGPGEAKQTREPEGGRWLIQRKRVEAGLATWEDVTRITAPKRTQRRSILLNAIRDGKVGNIAPSDRFRVLDEENADVLYLEPKEPREPEYVVRSEPDA